MYEPFPGNYVWNLSVNIALAMGGSIGEIADANALVTKAAEGGADAGTAAFFDAWTALADRVAAMGMADEAAGHAISAAHKYGRACAYYVTAERMQRHGYAPRERAYAKALETHASQNRVSARPWERIEIPYEGKTFPGLLTIAPARDGRPAPLMVFCNGLDSVKETVHLCGVAEAFAQRGVSTLIVDQPGVGEALRLQGLPAVVESERWAGAALDAIADRRDVDQDRLGMIGWSLGGYYSPRAAAFEKRFKLCVAWGANHCWGEMQVRRLANEGENPVPHYWEHVRWVWGQPDMDAYMAFVPAITLDGVVEKIAGPFLITHGANDRQIPLEYAHRSYAQATGSVRRELKIFTPAEGGVEHVSADNLEPVLSFITDWVVARFAEMA